jgi:hypothetical protein
VIVNTQEYTGLLNHMAIVYFIKKPAKLFTRWAVPSCLLGSNGWES